MMAAPSPSPYAKDLAALMEALSLHVTTACAKSFSTLLNKPSPLPAYAENPSSTSSAADKRRRYVRVGADWRQDVPFSYRAYGKARIMPSSTSYLKMRTNTTTRTNLWTSSWIIGIIKIRISKASTSTRNGKFFFVFSLSVCYAREGDSSCTHEFESTHGRKY